MEYTASTKKKWSAQHYAAPFLYLATSCQQTGKPGAVRESDHASIGNCCSGSVTGASDPRMNHLSVSGTLAANIRLTTTNLLALCVCTYLHLFSAQVHH
jgi:hypothetical protein